MVERNRWRIVALLALATALLWPAFVNGVPLMFPDALDYLTAARDLTLGVTRPPGYSWAILLPWHFGGVWLIAIAQALLTAWLMLLAIELCLPRRDALAIGIAGATVAIVATLSAAPFLASWILADALTAPTVLAAMILVAAPSLPRPTRFGLSVLLFLGALAHQTHVPAVLGAVAATLVVTWPVPGARAAAARCAGIAAAAVAVMLAANAWVHGVADTAVASPVFLLARLAADGLVAPHLPTACAEHPDMILCARRAWLDGMHLDAFLWRPDSPVWADYHGFERIRDDARRILSHLPVAVWPEAFANGLRRAAALIPALGLPDTDLRPMAEPMMSGLAHQMPELLEAVGRSPQLSGELAAIPATRAVKPVAAAALLVLPLALAVGGRVAALAAGLLGAMTANALVVGMTAEPYDRYQSRLAWLAVLLAGLAVAAVAARITLRRGAPA